MQSKPSKGCHGAEATAEGPFFATSEDCSTEEEMPGLGGALPTSDLKNLQKPFLAD